VPSSHPSCQKCTTFSNFQSFSRWSIRRPARRTKFARFRSSLTWKSLSQFLPGTRSAGRRRRLGGPGHGGNLNSSAAAAATSVRGANDLYSKEAYACVHAERFGVLYASGAQQRQAHMNRSHGCKTAMRGYYTVQSSVRATDREAGECPGSPAWAGSGSRGHG
jgi:hypothetical protein